MPKLGIATTARVTLPSSTPDDPAWCELKTELLLGDVMAVTDAGADSTKAITMLSHLIVAWNFTDESGSPVEPTPDWVNKLSTADFMFISAWIESNIAIDAKGGLSNAEKKASLSTLKEEATTPPAPTTISPPTI